MQNLMIHFQICLLATLGFLTFFAAHNVGDLDEMLQT